MQSGASIGICGIENYAAASAQVDTTSIAAGNSGGVDNNLVTVVAFGAQ
jgi:hypothetical protein